MATNPAPTIAERVPTNMLTPKDFFSPNPGRMDMELLVTAAKKHKIEPEVLMAFADVEAPKGPFLKDGRPTILFEAHVFSRNCSPKHKFDDSHPLISSRAWNSKLYGKGGSHQYDRLHRAMKLDQRAALMACSWGAYQVLAENYGMLSFKSAEECVLFMCESEANQFEVFLRFLVKRGIIADLQDSDFESAAYKYNGPRHADHDYAGRMRRRYKELTANILRPGATGPKVVRLQQLLVKHGQKIDVTGIFNQATEVAVKRLQEKWGLNIDGVVGPATYERLAVERIPDESILTSKRVAAGIGALGLGAGAIKTANDAEPVVAANDKQNAVVDMLKDVEGVTGTARQALTTAKETTAVARETVSYMQNTMYAMGILIVVLGAYIIWTKYHDRKKLQGVSSVTTVSA
jgi:peptidoglycan hydrolase-like protein with peptidoglycan-binding domain